MPALLIDLNFSHNLQDPFGDFDRYDYNGVIRVIEQDQSFLQIIYTLIGDHIKKISRSFDRGFNLSEQGFDFSSNPRAMRNTPSSLNIRNLGPDRKAAI